MNPSRNPTPLVRFSSDYDMTFVGVWRSFVVLSCATRLAPTPAYLVTANGAMLSGRAPSRSVIDMARATIQSCPSAVMVLNVAYCSAGSSWFVWR